MTKVTAAGLDALRFGVDGLVPVVVQDAATREVLMLAFADREALARTLAEGRAWYFSRSRQRLWRKGETSGNAQGVVEVRCDCDGDALLYLVRPHGPACHTGERSCFYRSLRAGERYPSHRSLTGPPSAGAAGGEAPAPDGSARTRAGGGQASRPGGGAEAGGGQASRPGGGAEAGGGGRWAPGTGGGGGTALGGILDEITGVLRDRRRELPDGSYSADLFRAGTARIAQKVGEEAVEVLVAALGNAREEVVAETADLVYHLLVLLVEAGIDLTEVWDELASRRIRPTAAPAFYT